MGQLIAGLSNPAWHAMWEDPAQGGMGVSDPDTTSGRGARTPMARAAFLEWFGA